MTFLSGVSIVDLSGSHGNGPFNEFLGVVLHVNQDENGTTDDFYRDNPDGVVPTFQVYKDGSIHQYFPLDFQPACQMDGNFNYAAIETAGLVDEALTDAQLQACGRIIAAYIAEPGLRMQAKIADKPGQPGLGWHGMGGDAWGGHPGCPGDIRKAQRQQILDIATGHQTEDDMTPEQEAKLDRVIDLLGEVIRGDEVDPPTGRTHPANLGRIFAELQKISAKLGA